MALRGMWAVSVLGLVAGCGPSLPCEQASLPNATPSYGATVVALVVTPARSGMRDASARERDTFEAFVIAQAERCDDAASATCSLTSLRTALGGLAAPDHPTLFTDIDAAIDPSLDAAHAEHPDVAARDCGGRSEDACDAWLVGRAFVRALCDLADSEGG